MKLNIFYFQINPPSKVRFLFLIKQLYLKGESLLNKSNFTSYDLDAIIMIIDDIESIRELTAKIAYLKNYKENHKDSKLPNDIEILNAQELLVNKKFNSIQELAVLTNEYLEGIPYKDYLEEMPVEKFVFFKSYKEIPLFEAKPFIDMLKQFLVNTKGEFEVAPYDFDNIRIVFEDDNQAWEFMSQCYQPTILFQNRGNQKAIVGCY